jgi:DNA ligase-1
MFLNGESLMAKSLSDRRELMKKNFKAVQNKFRFAVSLDAQEDGDTTAIEEFLDAAIKGQCEGLMVKTLDANSQYEPSKRSLNWLKLKKDYLEGMGDSVDLVPLGAYFGKGKRTGFYGAYLLGCYNEESDEFQSVCKCGTGFSDEVRLEKRDRIEERDHEFYRSHPSLRSSASLLPRSAGAPEPHEGTGRCRLRVQAQGIRRQRHPRARRLVLPQPGLGGESSRP